VSLLTEICALTKEVKVHFQEKRHLFFSSKVPNKNRTTHKENIRKTPTGNSTEIKELKTNFCVFVSLFVLFEFFFTKKNSRRTAL